MACSIKTSYYELGFFIFFFKGNIWAEQVVCHGALPYSAWHCQNCTDIQKNKPRNVTEDESHHLKLADKMHHYVFFKSSSSEEKEMKIIVLLWLKGTVRTWQALPAPRGWDGSCYQEHTLVSRAASWFTVWGQNEGLEDSLQHRKLPLEAVIKWFPEKWAENVVWATELLLSLHTAWAALQRCGSRAWGYSITQLKGVPLQWQKEQLWHVPWATEEQIQYIHCSANPLQTEKACAVAGTSASPCLEGCR